MGNDSSRPSGHFLKGRTRFIAVVSAIAILAAFTVGSAFAVLSGSPSNFEDNDGNMVVNTTGNNDWNSVTARSGYTHVTDKASTTADDSFTSGQKQDTTCPSLETHKNPPKDDFTDVATYTETQGAAPFHTFLYGATIRFTANGNASENVELNQGPDPCPVTGIAGETTLARVDGDKLIAIDYVSPGAKCPFDASFNGPACFAVGTWITDNTTEGPCFVGNDVAPCWGDNFTEIGGVAEAEGAVNDGLAGHSGAIAAVDNKISNAAVGLNQFAEFGIDLTAAGILPAGGPSGACKTFASGTFESRSSGSSFVSTTKDIAAVNKEITNCGQITIIKHTDPRGINQNFTYTSNISGGELSCTADTSPAGFTLNDSAGVDNSTNTEDCTNVPNGTYTVTESDPGPAFTLESLTCDPTASATISGGTATITVATNHVTCTYVNKPVLGALRIVKDSAKTGTFVKNAGAEFCYTTNSAGCSTTNVTDNGTGDQSTTIGEVCVSGLAVGTYYVKETKAPSGYALDSSLKQATVAAGTDCGTSKPTDAVSATFSDPPLADVQIRWKDDGSNELSLDGGATSGLTCTTTATTGTQDRTGTTDWKDTLTVPNIQVTSGSTPNVTITCTVKIDP